MFQLMFSPTQVTIVYAGSTLTPTPVIVPTDVPDPVATDTPVPAPTNTPVPAATNTPVPPPTNTPQPPAPTNTPQPPATGGSSNPPPAPTATYVPPPPLPKEIPELGLVAPKWQPLLLTLAVVIIALGLGVSQVKQLLQSEDGRGGQGSIRKEDD